MPYRYTLPRKSLIDITYLRKNKSGRCTAKGPYCRTFSQKKPQNGLRAAGRAHFAVALTNPCIYDQSTTTITLVRPSPHKCEVQHARIAIVICCLLAWSFDCVCFFLLASFIFFCFMSIYMPVFNSPFNFDHVQTTFFL